MAYVSQINAWLDRNDGKRFYAIYADITDVTPLEGGWRKRDLIGRLRTIEGYSKKYQSEIIGVVLGRMIALPAEADGLTRLDDEYQWRFGK